MLSLLISYRMACHLLSISGPIWKPFLDTMQVLLPFYLCRLCWEWACFGVFLTKRLILGCYFYRFFCPNFQNSIILFVDHARKHLKTIQLHAPLAFRPCGHRSSCQIFKYAIKFDVSIQLQTISHLLWWLSKKVY